MTKVGSLEGLPQDEVYPGVRRRVLDADHATVTMYAFAPAAAFPLHHHPQEQITLVDEGSVHMRIADDEELLGAGSWAVIPGHVPHGIVAGPQGARVTAVVAPRRGAADAYDIVRS